MNYLKEKKSIIALICCVISLSLSACSHYDYEQITGSIYGPQGLIHPGKPSYQKATEVDDLKLPPDLSKKMIRPLYAVPPLATPHHMKADSQTLRLPPESVVATVKQSELTNHEQGLSVDGKVNFIKTKTAGIVLVVAKPAAEAWAWLGEQLPSVGVNIVGQYAKQQTYTVRGLTSHSGLQVVHVKPLSDKQSEIWVSNRFGRRSSDTQVSNLLKRLLDKL